VTSDLTVIQFIKKE